MSMTDEAAKEDMDIHEVTVGAETFDQLLLHLSHEEAYGPATKSFDFNAKEFKLATWKGGIDEYITVRKGKSRHRSDDEA